MKFKEYKLEEIINCFDNKRKPLSSLQRQKIKGIYPYYGAQEIIDYIDRYIFDGKYLILAEDGENLRSNVKPLVKLIDGKFWINNHAHIFQTNEKCKIEYLYYALLKTNIKPFITGTTQPKLNQSNMLKIRVKIPNVYNQNKIVKILETIDRKISNNTQTNNNLYEIIKVQYNNFMSKITKYDLVKLKDIAIISSGKRPKNKGKEYKIPLIGASGIMSYTEDYNSDSDILVIGRVGTLGVVQRYFDKVWLSDNTISIKTEYINTLESYLRYVDYQSLNRGSTQPLITQTDINNLEIKFRKNEFVKFENEVKELRNRIVLNNMQNKVIEKVRDTLLPKLMNGEIDLDKIEI